MKSKPRHRDTYVTMQSPIGTTYAGVHRAVAARLIEKGWKIIKTEEQENRA